MIIISAGEIAALATATVWAVSCQLHASATRILGVPGVTLLRLPYGIALLGVMCLIMGVPAVFDPQIIMFLLCSAFFGVALCDTSFYRAVQIIGPRLGTLLQSMSACITAILGYLVLGEQIGVIGALGIGVAVFGVFFVLADGGNLTVTYKGQLSARELLAGAGMALFSALTLAISFILLKQAMLLGSSALWAAFLRLIFGGVMLLVFYSSRGWLHNIWSTFATSKRSWLYLGIGGLFSNFGIWMSGVAVQNTEAGIAATIIALEPVIIIPINAAFEKRMPSARAIAGTIIAFGGIAILFMR